MPIDLEECTLSSQPRVEQLRIEMIDKCKDKRLSFESEILKTSSSNCSRTSIGRVGRKARNENLDSQEDKENQENLITANEIRLFPKEHKRHFEKVLLAQIHQ